jgi:hypothetical protein
MVDASDGGCVRRIVVQGKTGETVERYPVSHGRGSFVIAKVVPPLQQQDPEHAQGRIGGTANRVLVPAKLLLQKPLDGFPIDHPLYIVKKSLELFAVGNGHIHESASPGLKPIGHLHPPDSI